MLSIQGRQALAKLTLPLSFLVSIALLLLGVVRPSAVEAVRIRAADSLAPAYRILAVPGSVLTRLKTDLAGLIELSAENVRLREENVRLRQWYNVAVTLADENAQLKANLHWIPDEAPRFVSGHVFRDASGLYGHSVLLDVGLSHSIHPGDVALDSSGLIGRVTEIGARTVRILLINDDASRLPVSLGSSHASAIMAGDGSRYPRLIYYAQDNRPIEGERVVTQEQAPPQAPPRAQGALAGLPGGCLSAPFIICSRGRLLSFLRPI